MKKDKVITVLLIVLLLLIVIIFALSNSLENKSTFKKPPFDVTVSSNIPNDMIKTDKVLEVVPGYSLYIEPIPKVYNNFLIINFVSLSTNNIWIKIRVLQNEEIIAESGLVKPGEYLEKIKLNTSKLSNDNITYVIMGYEIDTYFSAGMIKLNTRIGV